MSDDAPPVFHPGFRVLVVDGNIDAANTARMLLAAIGISCRAAYSGEEAVDEARGFHPHVVLMDLHMPSADGFAAARLLRSAAETRGSALVALTGGTAPEDLARSRQAGFDFHLCKPTNPRELIALLHHIHAMTTVN